MDATCDTITAIRMLQRLLKQKTGVEVICFNVSLACINNGKGCVTLRPRILEPLHEIFLAICKAKGVKIVGALGLCKGPGLIMQKVYRKHNIHFPTLILTHICFRIRKQQEGWTSIPELQDPGQRRPRFA
jgi:hypothetical protein